MASVLISDGVVHACLVACLVGPVERRNFELYSASAAT